mmetsp:Transcript_36079/g.103755  ORF Transcript_36079/g.103755 Transcript_36079/m.103755 type:complete len:95 (+) Transcript_36079:69-353(+)
MGAGMLRPHEGLAFISGAARQAAPAPVPQRHSALAAALAAALPCAPCAEALVHSLVIAAWRRAPRIAPPQSWKQAASSFDELLEWASSENEAAA